MLAERPLRDWSCNAAKCIVDYIHDRTQSSGYIGPVHVQVGIEDSTHPTSSITTNIPFKDAWHVAGGAQYRVSEPWLLNFGIAYDSGFQQNSSQVSLLPPLNTAWRFGVSGRQQLSKKTSYWGEYLYGGTLNTDIDARPVARWPRRSRRRVQRHRHIVLRRVSELDVLTEATGA